MFSPKSLAHRISIAGLAVLMLGGAWAQAEKDVAGLSLLDAVGRTLSSNTSVRLQQRQVEVANAVKRQAAGQFDLVLGAGVNTSRDEQPLTGSQKAQYGINLLRTDAQTLNLRASQLFDNGWSWSGTYSTSRTSGTLSELGNLPAQNLGRLDFALVVPFGRGSGSVARANLSIAELETKASGHDLQHTLSQSVLSTVNAYWALVAAQKNLDLASEAEASLVQLLGEVEKLVAADELPAAELNLINANLIDKRAQRLAAERLVVDSRLSLGRFMGAASSDMDSIRLLNDFPGNLQVPDVDAARIAALSASGLRNRADLAAAQIRTESARLAIDAALINLKPKIDLKFNVGLAGLYEGANAANSLLPYLQGHPGKSVGVALQYEWPVGNQTNLGLLDQQTAIWDQRVIQANDLRNSIGVGIQQATQGVQKAALQVQASTRSLELYQKTLENEKIKHRLGQATLIQVLNVNDLLISARAAMVSYLSNYFSAVARLRFEMGQLIDGQGGGHSISLDQIVTIPGAGSP